MRYEAEFRVNHHSYMLEVDGAISLLELLRTDLGLTGTKEGCDDSECGACMVLIDGEPVNSCSYIALQAAGSDIVTVEGLSPDGVLHPIQKAFLAEGGVQCGYCTPGMIVSAKALLDAKSDPTEDDVRQALGGNLCRCTGYQKIVRAILKAAAEMAAAG